MLATLIQQNYKYFIIITIHDNWRWPWSKRTINILLLLLFINEINSQLTLALIQQNYKYFIVIIY